MRYFQPFEAKLQPIIETVPQFARAYDGDWSDFSTPMRAAVFIARDILTANADIPSKRGGANSMCLFTLRASGLFATYPELDLVAAVLIAERYIDEKREREEARATT